MSYRDFGRGFPLPEGYGRYPRRNDSFSRHDDYPSQPGNAYPFRHGYGPDDYYSRPDFPPRGGVHPPYGGSLGDNPAVERLGPPMSQDYGDRTHLQHRDGDLLARGNYERSFSGPPSRTDDRRFTESASEAYSRSDRNYNQGNEKNFHGNDGASRAVSSSQEMGRDKDTKMNCENSPAGSRSQKPDLSIDVLLQDERLKNVLFAGISKATAKLEQSLKSVRGETPDSGEIPGLSSRSQVFSVHSPSGDPPLRPKSILKRTGAEKSSGEVEASSDSLSKLSALEKTLHLLRTKSDPKGSSSYSEKSGKDSLKQPVAPKDGLAPYKDRGDISESHFYDEKSQKQLETKLSASSNQPFWSVDAFTERIGKEPDTFDAQEKLYEQWRQSINRSSEGQNIPANMRGMPQVDPTYESKMPSSAAAAAAATLSQIQQEAENDNEELDVTVQNILQSIGFNFDLSKRMQELARKKKQQQDVLHTGAINQSATFLGKSDGLVQDVKAALFSNREENIENFIREARTSIQKTGSNYERSGSPGQRTDLPPRERSNDRRGRSPEHSSRSVDETQNPKRSSVETFDIQNEKHPRISQMSRDWESLSPEENDWKMMESQEKSIEVRQLSSSRERNAATPPHSKYLDDRIQQGKKCISGRHDAGSPWSSDRFRDEAKDEHFYPYERTESSVAMSQSRTSSGRRKEDGLSQAVKLISSHSGPTHVENLKVTSRAVYDDEPFAETRRITFLSKCDHRVVSQSPVYTGLPSPENRLPYKRSASPLSPPHSKDRRVYSARDDYNDRNHDQSVYKRDRQQSPELKIRVTRERSPEWRKLSPSRQPYDYESHLKSPPPTTGSQVFDSRLNDRIIMSSERTNPPLGDTREGKFFDRRKSRSPSPHTCRFPGMARSRSPQRPRSRSPYRSRSRSPGKLVFRSPRRSRSNSPYRPRSRSPRSRFRSPRRSRSRSLRRSRSRSLRRLRSRSPDRRRSRSPRRVKSRSRSLGRSRPRSPGKVTSGIRSPSRRRSRSPKLSETLRRHRSRSKSFDRYKKSHELSPKWGRPSATKPGSPNRRQSIGYRRNSSIEKSLKADRDGKASAVKSWQDSKNKPSEQVKVDVSKLPPDDRRTYLQKLLKDKEVNKAKGQGDAISAVKRQGDILSAVKGEGDILSAFKGQGDILSAVKERGDIHSAVKGQGDILSAVKGQGDILSAVKGEGDILSAVKGQGDILSAVKGQGDILSAVKGLVSLTVEERKDVLLKMTNATPKEKQQILQNLTAREDKVSALKLELEKLQKEQNEIMRKCQRSGQGTSEPMLLKNKTAQEELEKEITRLSGPGLEAVLDLFTLPKKVVKKGALKTDLGRDTVVVKKTKLQKPISVMKSASENKNKQMKGKSVALPHEKKQTAAGSAVAAKEGNKLDKTKKPDSETPNLPCTASKSNVYYEYFDCGNHFCKHCSVTFPTAEQFFTHCHSKAHLTKTESEKKPWKDRKHELSLAQKVGASHSRRMRGSEMMFPVIGTYCSLCKVFCGDFADSVQHLKTDGHFDKYSEYAKQNIGYEKNLLLDATKAAKVAKEPPVKKERNKQSDVLPPPSQMEKLSDVESSGKKSDSCDKQTKIKSAKKHLRVSNKGSDSDSSKQDSSSVVDMEQNDEVKVDDPHIKVPKLTKPSTTIPVLTSLTNEVSISKEDMKENKEDDNQPLDKFLTIKQESRTGKKSSLPVVKGPELDLLSIPIPEDSNPSPDTSDFSKPCVIYTVKSRQQMQEEDKKIIDDEKRMMGIDVDADEEQPMFVIPTPPPSLIYVPLSELSEVKSEESSDIRQKNLDILFTKVSKTVSRRKKPTRWGSGAVDMGPAVSDMEQKIQKQIEAKVAKAKFRMMQKKHNEEGRERISEEASITKKKHRGEASESSDESVELVEGEDSAGCDISKAEVGSKEADSENKESETENKKEAGDNMEAALDSKETEIFNGGRKETVETAVDDKETEMFNIETAVDDKETEMFNTETAVDDKETEILNIETAVDDKEMETAVDDKTAEILDTETAVDDKQTEILNMETGVDSKETEIFNMATAVDNNEIEFDNKGEADHINVEAAEDHNSATTDVSSVSGVNNHFVSTDFAQSCLSYTSAETAQVLTSESTVPSSVEEPAGTEHCEAGSSKQQETRKSNVSQDPLSDIAQAISGVSSSEKVGISGVGSSEKVGISGVGTSEKVGISGVGSSEKVGISGVVSSEKQAISDITMAISGVVFSENMSVKELSKTNNSRAESKSPSIDIGDLSTIFIAAENLDSDKFLVKDNLIALSEITRDDDENEFCVQGDENTTAGSQGYENSTVGNAASRQNFLGSSAVKDFDSQVDTSERVETETASDLSVGSRERISLDSMSGEDGSVSEITVEQYRLRENQGLGDSTDQEFGSYKDRIISDLKEKPETVTSSSGRGQGSKPLKKGCGSAQGRKLVTKMENSTDNFLLCVQNEKSSSSAGSARSNDAREHASFPKDSHESQIWETEPEEMQNAIRSTEKAESLPNKQKIIAEIAESPGCTTRSRARNDKSEMTAGDGMGEDERPKFEDTDLNVALLVQKTENVEVSDLTRLSVPKFVVLISDSDSETTVTEKIEVSNSLVIPPDTDTLGCVGHINLENLPGVYERQEEDGPHQLSVLPGSDVIGEKELGFLQLSELSDLPESDRKVEEQDFHQQSGLAAREARTEEQQDFHQQSDLAVHEARTEEQQDFQQLPELLILSGSDGRMGESLQHPPGQQPLSDDVVALSMDHEHLPEQELSCPSGRQAGSNAVSQQPCHGQSRDPPMSGVVGDVEESVDSMMLAVTEVHGESLEAEALPTAGLSLGLEGEDTMEFAMVDMEEKMETADE